MSSKPWDIRKDEPRKADQLVNFIIFCEDTVSEPTYFQFFETEKIKVNCIKDQKNMMKHVLLAIGKCKQDGLLNPEDPNSKLDDDLQVWCVFDRDKEETDEKIEAGNSEFDESITAALHRGLKLAWSNDSFELWILLHFLDVSASEVNRIDYYKRLTEYLKTQVHLNEDLKKAVDSGHFEYKSSCKSLRSFREIVRPFVEDKVLVAIDRAEKLEKQFESKSAYHQKSPYTRVHHLVKVLLEKGGRKIEGS
ncbi:MAG: RloB domain-containing protein [Flavobacteriales bacterium]|nr:RloB domain-containing protein [Flavobacteriales bacterium]